MFSDLSTDSWLQAATAETRKKVLRALFDSTHYQERDLKHVQDFYGLSESKLFTVQEVVDEAVALAIEHPLKNEVMFHVANLKAYRLKEKIPKRSIEAFNEALKLAQDAGDDDLVNQILAHRCFFYFHNKRKKQAQEDAPKIKVDQLPEVDQKWVKRDLPKWLKG